MKAALAVTLSLALLAGSAFAGETQQPTVKAIAPASLPADSVSFYSVALTCSSAPELGCDSRAKRVLRSLTTDFSVASAWVNEAGTKLAIGWRPAANALSADQLNQILGPHSLAVNAIDDKTRPELLASFRTNEGWFDSHTIDELSRKESAIIAERLVRRLAKRVPVTETQSATLVKAIMDSCWDRSGCQVEKDIASIAQTAKLGQPGADALRDVVALGYRPLENEE